MAVARISNARNVTEVARVRRGVTQLSNLHVLLPAALLGRGGDMFVVLGDVRVSFVCLYDRLLGLIRCRPIFHDNSAVIAGLLSSLLLLRHLLQVCGIGFILIDILRLLILKHLKKLLLLVVEGVLGAVHRRLRSAGHLSVLLLELRLGLLDYLGRGRDGWHLGLAFIAKAVKLDTVAPTS